MDRELNQIAAAMWLPIIWLSHMIEAHQTFIEQVIYEAGTAE